MIFLIPSNLFLFLVFPPLFSFFSLAILAIQILKLLLVINVELVCFFVTLQNYFRLIKAFENGQPHSSGYLVALVVILVALAAPNVSSPSIFQIDIFQSLGFHEENMRIDASKLEGISSLTNTEVLGQTFTVELTGQLGSLLKNPLLLDLSGLGNGSLGGQVGLGIIIHFEGIGGKDLRGTEGLHVLLVKKLAVSLFISSKVFLELGEGAGVFEVLVVLRIFFSLTFSSPQIGGVLGLVGFVVSEVFAVEPLCVQVEQEIDVVFLEFFVELIGLLLRALTVRDLSKDNY